MPRELCFNGVNGATGRRLQAPMSPEQLLPWIEGDDRHTTQAVHDDQHTLYERRVEARQAGVYGLLHNVDALDAKEAGWGVIFAPGTPLAARDGLADLIAARGGKELDYVPGESAQKFRARRDQAVGAVDPKKLPYYILIVGPPTEIPFRFQYELDAEHAVGRLYFDDPQDFGRYAKRLLDYEKPNRALSRERRAAFFSPLHAGDEATALSAIELAAPLAQNLDGAPLTLNKAAGPSFTYRTENVSGAAATKPALLDLLKRQQHAPALVFTASHGVGYPKDDPDVQRKQQGALACCGPDWPGPAQWPDEKPLPDSAYLAGDDPQLSGVDFDGLMVFSFACYSAGTPQVGDFAYLKDKPPEEKADQPFVARLPQRLLAQGALAFIGHVDRAWGYSIAGMPGDVDIFQYTLEALLAGAPVGRAFEYFNDKCTALSRMLADREEDSLLHKYHLHEPVAPEELAWTWAARNDARAYITLGDPFARLQPARMAAA